MIEPERIAQAKAEADEFAAGVLETLQSEDPTDEELLVGLEIVVAALQEVLDRERARLHVTEAELDEAARELLKEAQ